MFNFQQFYVQYSLIYSNKSHPNIQFLEWFIGFSEGDGSFIITKRGDLMFVISQKHTNLNLLNYIQKELGFGNICIQSKKNNIYRFIVQDLNSLYLICLLFNGNMVLPTRNAKFLIFLTTLNFKLIKSTKKLALNKNKLLESYKEKKQIQPNINTNYPSLNNKWWIGFIEAEGCFTASVLSNQTAVRIRFIVSQKWEVNKSVLEYFLKQLNESYVLPLSNNLITQNSLGAVVPHSEINNWELRINGIKNCNLFKKFLKLEDFKSTKKESILKWLEILNHFENKDHLILEKRKDLLKLVKTINKLEKK